MAKPYSMDLRELANIRSLPVSFRRHSRFVQHS